MNEIDPIIKKAIEKTSGPCVVIAGAGTGKTFTIRKKITYLVKNNLYKPEEILCLTFSNEATNNLKRKINDDFVENNIRGFERITIKTFHAFCSDILKENGVKVDICPDFDILLPDDAKVMVHKYLNVDPYWSNRYISTIHTVQDLGVEKSKIAEYVKDLENKLINYGESSDLDKVYLKIKTAQNTLYLNEKTDPKGQRELKKELNYFIDIYDDYKKYSEFLEFWNKYNQFKKEKHYLDYSDLNVSVLELFKLFGSEKYIEKYKYVFVDEFQDTNKLQFDLIDYIAKHQNITVVGDPNQSIYGFRGAYKKSFEDFKINFKVTNEDVYKLERSHRSPNTVLNVSYDLIKNNYENSEECLKIENVKGIAGNKVNIIELIDKYEEARFIADKVLEELDSGVKPKEICILIRTHKQAEIIRTALDSKGIKYIYSGRTNILRFREIKTVISYLSILCNLINRTGYGDQSWWHLFHYSNQLSPEDSIKIGRCLKKNRDQELSIDQALLASQIDLSDEGKRIVNKVITKLKELSLISNKNLPELILDIYELSGLNRAFTHTRSPENIEHLFNLKKFYELAENFNNLHSKELPDFINYLEMLDKLDITIESEYLSEIDAVRLMTIHAVKGLEFDTVIVTNLAEKRFPLDRTQNEPLIPKLLKPDIASILSSCIDIDTLTEKKRDEKIKALEKASLLYDERRLCYVGFTRAKENLIITYAKAYSPKKESLESIFLNEINYKENNNCIFIEDQEQKSTIMSPNSRSEEHKSELKKQLIYSLDTDTPKEIIDRLLNYLVCRKDNDPSKLASIISNFSPNIKELEKCQLKEKEQKSGLIFNKEKSFTFSPSSINNYLECPKKFELQNLYQMPQRGFFDEAEEVGTNAMDRGSLVHEVMENIVKEKIYNKEEIPALVEKLYAQEKYKNKILALDLPLIKQMVDVSYLRNISYIKSAEKTTTEEELHLILDGFKFIGFADRLDFNKDGTVDIIDYKTNKNTIDGKKRQIQLGFYALALQKRGYKVKRLVLDMLRLEKPVELIVEEDQISVKGGIGTNSRADFNLKDFRQELIEICNQISHDYEHEFIPTDDSNKCRFCGYKLYCPKWDE